MFSGGMSPWHILIIVGACVVLFGAKRLPDAARSLGRSARIFKAETRGLMDDDPAELDAPRPYAATAQAEPYASTSHASPAQAGAAGTPARASGAGTPAQADGAGTPTRADGAGTPARADGMGTPAQPGDAAGPRSGSYAGTAGQTDAGATARGGEGR